MLNRSHLCLVSSSFAAFLQNSTASLHETRIGYNAADVENRQAPRFIVSERSVSRPTQNLGSQILVLLETFINHFLLGDPMEDSILDSTQFSR